MAKDSDRGEASRGGGAGDWAAFNKVRSGSRADVAVLTSFVDKDELEDGWALIYRGSEEMAANLERIVGKWLGVLHEHG